MKKKPLLIVFLSVFIDLIGFGIVLPLLPMYSREFGASGLMVGFIIASYSMMQFVFAPIWGRLSDRVGRRPIILLSNLAASGSYLLFAYGSIYGAGWGLVILLISRVFAGICGANISVASAYIADVTEAGNRSKGMGLIGMAFGLGFILGPALGSLSAGLFGRPGPGLVAAVFCAANFVFGYFMLPESRRVGAKTAARRATWAQWRHTLSQPVIGFLIGLYFLTTFCFTCFETTFSLYLRENEHFLYDETQVGYLFAFCGLVAAAVQNPGTIGRLVKRLGEKRLIAVSLVVFAVSFVILPAATSLAGLLVGLAILAIGSGINRPPTFGLISVNTSEEEQGVSMGVAQSAGAMARILGPLFAGPLFVWKQVSPYVLSAALTLIGAVVAWRYLCGGRKAGKPAAEMAGTESPHPADQSG